MDEEADKNLTQEEENNDSCPPTPKKDPLPSPSEKEDDTPSEKPEILLRPPIEPQPDSNRFSAATLPLPDRPQSTASEINNESIYDQLPATLPRKPISAAAVIPPPVTEEPSAEDGDSAKQREIQEIEANQKKYDNINTHKVCTIVTMILCSVILNIFAFSCLIPAYLYSMKSRESLNSEDLPNAEKFARRSLILNLIAVIVTFTVLFAVFIILQIVFAASNLY